MGWLKGLKQRLAASVSPAAPAADDATDWKDTLLKHFDLTDVLGVGGYSTVYRGRRRADGRPYAVKVTNLDSLTDWSRQAAVREARVLATMTGAGSFRHPCIATYREAFCLGSRLCIVTDPAPGGDLRRLLEQRTAAGGQLSEREVWSIFLQVTLALQHLHAHRVLHRDLKPGNVLINRQAGQPHVQLTDFGICGQLSRVFTRKQAGSPQYKAPEMWAGQPYSFSSDMWALGCLLHELCTGRPLFDAPPGCTQDAAVQAVKEQVLALSGPPPLPSGYSHDVASLLALLLRPNPAERPSAAELLSLPAVAARIHEVPAVVRDGLAGAAAAQQSWQRQQVRLPQQEACPAVLKGTASEPVSFTPRDVNACLPPAAYSAGDGGLLGSSQRAQQACEDREQRGRRSGRQGGAPALRERSASGSSVRSAASSSGSAASIACLDLAVPHDSAASLTAGLGAGLSGKGRPVAPQEAAGGSPASVKRGAGRADSVKSCLASLTRQSCPDFLQTAASSTTVHI